jgi:hypothetical protein
MDAEAVLKHGVSNEQTSGEKKSLSKGGVFLFFLFFSSPDANFRLIGQAFGSSFMFYSSS